MKIHLLYRIVILTTSVMVMAVPALPAAPLADTNVDACSFQHELFSHSFATNNNGESQCHFSNYSKRVQHCWKSVSPAVSIC
jgi:hypothetical protein